MNNKKYAHWISGGLLVLATTAAQADLLIYTASLSGAAEATPNASPGFGSATVTIDTVSHTMLVDVMFDALMGLTTAAHIHCCTAAAATGTAGVASAVPNFPGFPTGVSAGSYNASFDLTLASSWNGTFITANGGTTAGAEAALLAGLDDELAYLNIHSNLFPAGEIRGFLTRAIPEPTALTLLGLGLGGLLGCWAGGGAERERAYIPAHTSAAASTWIGALAAA